MSTIITSYEIVKYGPGRENYPTRFLCNHIKKEELLHFSKCYLGLDFRDALIDDLTIPDPEAIPKWSASQSGGYNIDDIVCYDGCPFISLTDGNTDSPDDTNNWAIPDKFVNPLYNGLWHDGCLKHWLAFCVYHTSVKYSTYDIGAKGITRLKDDETGIETVDLKTFHSVKSEIKDDAEDYLWLMYEYMKRKHDQDSENFSFMTTVLDPCGKTKCIEPKRNRQKRSKYLK